MFQYDESGRGCFRYVIYGQPASKKNGGRIVRNRATGRVAILPNKRYVDYEKRAAEALSDRDTVTALFCPVNVKAIFYRADHRRVDLVNLQEALCDVLVKYQIIGDDCRDIVYSMDGSRVFYDKDNPRTEIEITPVDGDSWNTNNRRLTEIGYTLI